MVLNSLVSGGSCIEVDVEELLEVDLDEVDELVEVDDEVEEGGLVGDVVVPNSLVSLDETETSVEDAMKVLSGVEQATVLDETTVVELLVELANVEVDEVGEEVMKEEVVDKEVMKEEVVEEEVMKEEVVDKEVVEEEVVDEESELAC